MNSISKTNRALAKSGSFGFTQALVLSVGAKPNVPLVRLPKNFFLCGRSVLIFFKLRNVGWLVNQIRLKVVSFVCRCPPVKMFGCVVQFMFYVVR